MSRHTSRRGDETSSEVTLDPADWSQVRELGHRMVDEMMTYLEVASERPVWQPVPGEVKASFTGPAPREPQDVEEVYEEFRERVLPYPYGNIHPRFWGWVNGTGTPIGMLSEMLAAAMNPNVAGFEQSAVYVEEQVLAWCKEMLGYPAEASGLLVTGGSMANLLGLAVARQARAGYDVRRFGLQGENPRLMVYASSEAHSSVQKAVELLGLGAESLRKVPTYPDFRIDLDALIETIREDRRQGLRPIAVVGNAGTVNSGAIDDLEALRQICDVEDLWLHVDGAFGALAAISPKLRPLVRGLEGADSLAFDLHKWMYMPYDVGCVLVRDREAHRAAFQLVPSYLKPLRGGVTSGPLMYADYGIELSRCFRALKVWMSLKANGVERYARQVEQNVEQARYLASRIEASPHLELLAPVSLNVVSFRYVVPDTGDKTLNDLNGELLVRLQESGAAVPSLRVLAGRAGLCLAITNHRTRRSDLDLLLDETLRIGRALRDELWGVEAPVSPALLAPSRDEAPAAALEG